MIAIMILKLPIEPISEALSGNRHWEAEGLGKTGEVYLVGPDQTMRVDSRSWSRIARRSSRASANRG